MNLKNIINTVTDYIKYTTLDDGFLNMLCDKKKFIYLDVLKSKYLYLLDITEKEYIEIVDECIYQYRGEVKDTYKDGKKFIKEYELLDYKLLNELYLIMNKYISEKLEVSISTEWNETTIDMYNKYFIHNVEIKLKEKDLGIKFIHLQKYIFDTLVTDTKNCIMNEILDNFPNYLVFHEYSIDNDRKLGIFEDKCIDKVVDAHNQKLKKKNELIEYANNIQLPNKVFNIFHTLHKLFSDREGDNQYKQDFNIEIFTKYHSGITVVDENYYNKENDTFGKLIGTDESLKNNNNDLTYIYDENTFIIKENISDGTYPDGEYYCNTYYELYNEDEDLIFEFSINDNEREDHIFKWLETIIKSDIKVFKKGEWISQVVKLFDTIENRRNQDKKSFNKERYLKELDSFSEI